MSGEITSLSCTSGTGDIVLVTQIWKEVDGMTQEMAKHNALMTQMLIDMHQQNKILTDALATSLTGKDYDTIKGTDNNVCDMTSKVITGKDYASLELGKTGGKSGEYDTSLNGRLHKTTEMITGILVGLFTEDEIKAKLSATDINKLSSIESNLGSMAAGASFMKNNLRRSSTFTEDGGDVQRTTNPLIEIERAIKALVLSYTHGDLKGDVKMAELRNEPFPTNIPQPFWDELKAAYAKATGDFIKTINEYDPNPTDNHDFGELNITDEKQ